MNTGGAGAAMKHLARRRDRVRRGAVALGLLAAALAARADTVDIVGGFTQYFGPLERYAPGTSLDRQTVFSIPGAYSFDASPFQPYANLPPSVWERYGIGEGNVSFIGHVGETRSQIDFSIDSHVPATPTYRNSVAFTPTVGANVQVGDVFKLGTFTFTNGTWLGDLPDSYFQLRLRTVSSNPALDGHEVTTYLGLHITSGLSADGQNYSAAPIDNADYFYLNSDPFTPPFLGGGQIIGYAGVYETDAALQPPGGTNTGTVDLYGKIGSLIPTSFENPQGLTLQASIPVVPNLSPVPEPSTWALWLAGLGACALRRRALPPPVPGA